jgi:dTDP-4-amino-4,6-dideoxygalactose transaminase
MAQEVLKYDWPSWPEVDRDTLDAVAATLYTRRWAIASSPSKSGSCIDTVESKLATLFGRSFCITTCNGSAAIVIALQALGIGSGDRVLVPALTWVGCATAILRVGAIPVFADSGENTPLMEVTELQRAKLGHVDAILAVHLYASQLSIEALQRSFPGIPIIEDCSHCQGVRDADGSPIGKRGEIAICSFQGSKILTCGEGGATFTDSPELAYRLAALRADSRIRPQQNSPWREVDLEPFTLVHGANFAMSEIAAGLLLEQLTRFPAQSQRRTQGIKDFLTVAQALGLQVIGDESGFQFGAFYGVMVWLAEDVFDRDTSREDFLRQLQQQCKIVLSPVYPPIPRSPLYQPASMKQYAKLATSNFDVTHADRWYRSAVVVPHWAFLASGSALVGLAHSLADLTNSRLQPRSIAVPKWEPLEQEANCTNTPEIAVVILTNRQRSTLSEALASVAAQDYLGNVRVLIMKDESNSPLEPPVQYFEHFPNVREIALIAKDFFQDSPPVARVARLRNLALEFVDSPLVCFLDDDNFWEPNHLSSLWQAMTEHRIPAVHSWRRLVNRDGTAWQGDCFPWLPSGDVERHRYSICLEHGLIHLGSPVVRDTVSLLVGSEDFGIVDMGAWLLDATLIRQLRFSTSYSEQELAEMCGEDDKLLWRLREFGVGTACTNQPTLIYKLGGLSNTFKVDR